MKLTRHRIVMKRLLPGLLSLFAVGILAACGGNATQATTSAPIATPKTPLQISQLLSYTQANANTSEQASYPDPSNQKALPASVKVTGSGETVLLRASVVQGYQVYECQPSPTNKNSFAWALQSPLTILKTDQGTNIIHSAGPSWLYTQDGSMIVGAIGNFTSSNHKVVPASATPNASAIPWLRLDVKNHLGKTGLFSNVNEVQRLYTKGGIAPSNGCNQNTAHQHVLKQVGYTAEYVFWGHKK
ncbi:MAG TPA: DUF3455 domain-containing protein [Ktedonobacteraceae bacterium]|jgi:hypothetical protein|nr:DUF3455 domain-containing protein [Ktedonobacteraceae bacterium]